MHLGDLQARSEGHKALRESDRRAPGETESESPISSGMHASTRVACQVQGSGASPGYTTAPPLCFLSKR